MEFRLTRSEQPWRCQVKLRYENQAEIDFGRPLSGTDEHTLESLLRRAQLALLNPTVDPKMFLDLDLSDQRVLNNTAPFGGDKQLAFTSGTVIVEISSPQLMDLTFIDLPGKQTAFYVRSLLRTCLLGIIQNAPEGEDRSIVGLVSSLVKKYISGDTLILLTISMKGIIMFRHLLSPYSNGTQMTL
jgi:hypothetical protein